MLLNAGSVKPPGMTPEWGITSLASELQEANAARDHAQAEVKQLKASNQQLLSATGQDAANEGMVELQRQLDEANQQFASREGAGSTKALVGNAKLLKKSFSSATNGSKRPVMSVVCP